MRHALKFYNKSVGNFQMPSDKKVEFVVPEDIEDEDEVDLSEDEDEDEEIDLEDEDLELEDEADGNEMDMMSAFAGILRGTFHLPPNEEDEDEYEEETKNICEVLSDVGQGMDGIRKSVDTQNKILLKILTAINNK